MDLPEGKKVSDLVGEYLALRKSKKQYEDQIDEAMRTKFEEPMKKLEAILLDYLNEQGLQSASAADGGTVYKIRFTSVTTADGAEFRRHVIGSEDWELADWKPNKTVINDIVDRGEPLPPGVNRSVIYKIGLTKGKS